MKIKEISVNDRPRERLIYKGADSLSDAEILAILIEKGNKNENVIELSHKIISSFGLVSLKEINVKELTAIKGIGNAKATKIIAAIELGRRINSGKIHETIVKNPSDIAKHYIAKMKDYKKEHLIAVFLDSKNKIIKDTVISVGTLDSSLVHPREVFKEAIKNSAASLILVHNHPSGDSTPSREDEIVTSKFIEAGRLLNINVLDHVVIGKEEWKSAIN